MLFSRDNLPRIKDGAYIINFDDKQGKEKHWVNQNAVVYFDPFEIEYTSQEVLNKIKHKSITHNIFSIPSDDSFMCRLYCMAFIEFMNSVKDFFILYQSIFS